MHSVIRTWHHSQCEYVCAGRLRIDPATIHEKTRFVKRLPDYKVKIAKTGPGPVEWQIVKTFPDYNIQMVNSFPDFTAGFSGGVPERAE